MAAPKRWKCFLCLLCATVGLLVLLTSPYMRKQQLDPYWRDMNSYIRMSSGEQNGNIRVSGGEQNSNIRMSSGEQTVTSVRPWLHSNVTARCDDVLRGMLVGRWQQRKMTDEEVETMRVFHKRVREEEHGTPKGVQRPDKRCGNLAVGTKGRLFWFRALCDSEGATPCCYNYVCVNRTMDQCTCPDCIDMRRPLHAEYSTWQPTDVACRPRDMRTDEMCQFLGQANLTFIGDSLVRHLYTAFVLMMTGDDQAGAFKPNIPAEMRKKCAGIYMFSEVVCRHWLNSRGSVCGGNVTLRNHYLTTTSTAARIRNVVLELGNRTRSLVVLGIGFHDKMNYARVVGAVVRPLLQTMKTQRLVWPRLLWATIHKFGEMRTPLTHENTETAKHFNDKMKSFLAAWKVPVFDTFNLTDKVMSFDGQHYGFGVNKVKAKILANYLHQLYVQGRW